MRVILAVLLLMTFSCKETIPANSVVISMKGKWKFDEGNQYYKYETGDSIKNGDFEKKLILAFYPDTNNIQEKVSYNTIKNQTISINIDTLQIEQVEKQPFYLYKEIDDKSGVLIKIKKLERLEVVTYPSTIYD